MESLVPPRIDTGENGKRLSNLILETKRGRISSSLRRVHSPPAMDGALAHGERDGVADYGLLNSSKDVHLSFHWRLPLTKICLVPLVGTQMSSGSTHNLHILAAD